MYQKFNKSSNFTFGQKIINILIMKKLYLKRTYLGSTYTIGHLYVDGVYFCDTIEDVVRDLKTKEDKVYAKTAIPEGTYKVVVNYSNNLKRRLPLLIDVPFFTGIRIHKGVNENSSAGCIIVGENKIKGRVINSQKYEDTLVKLLDGNQATITIKNQF